MRKKQREQQEREREQHRSALSSPLLAARAPSQRPSWRFPRSPSTRASSLALLLVPWTWEPEEPEEREQQQRRQELFALAPS